MRGTSRGWLWGVGLCGMGLCACGAMGCDREPAPAPPVLPAPAGTQVAAASEPKVTKPEVPQGTSSAQPPLGKRAGEPGSKNLPPPTPNAVRLVVVHEAPELLTSEKGQINQLQKQIEKADQKVDGGEPSEAEKAYLADYAKLPEAPPNLPDAWASFETVVVLRVEEPRKIGTQGQTIGGRTHLLVLHPPSVTPVYSTIYAERAENFSAPSIDGARLGIWIKNHLTFRKAAK